MTNYILHRCPTKRKRRIGWKPLGEAVTLARGGEVISTRKRACWDSELWRCGVYASKISVFISTLCLSG